MCITRLFVFHISVKSEDSLVECGTKVSINYINIICLFASIITKQLKNKFHGNNYVKLFYDKSKVVYDN